GESFQDIAYTDQPIPVGEGQTISQPYMVALMTELLKIEGHEKVLEIGTGTGYQTAILAKLAGQVFTIEIIESLAIKSKKLLEELGYKNIHFKIGDGYFGWEEYTPFDLIIVTCGPERIPEPLIDQLAEKGRLVIPVGYEYQILTIMEKVNGRLKKTESISCRFVPMTGGMGQDRSYNI
ncbi:protein-L-isoaspartate(D-aspartate) O-methyltransferase, partial [Candidatus Poribacteria bacterium]|nr:protein-L-isoaspartate(D-aspartate) O-methyltransferase [Candidatus Poribacteria bacterium]